MTPWGAGDFFLTICSSQKHFPFKKSSDSPQIFLHALNDFQMAKRFNESPHGLHPPISVFATFGAGIVLEGRGDEMPEFHICDNHITGAKSTGIDAST